MEEKDSFVVREPAVAYATLTYADVMSYLHSVHLTREDKERVARRLTVEVSEPYLADAYETIDRLSALRSNWDGEGALPISPKVLRNIKEVLLMSGNSDWESWSISPDGNGTIGLQSKHSKALISLGALEFSYFVIVDGEAYGESHLDFNPEVFLGIMRKFG